MRRSRSGADTALPPVDRSPERALVYTLQPSLHHYRLPLWDLLVEHGRGRYDFHAFGEMSDSQAFGGGTREYLHHTPTHRLRVPFIELLRWPQAARLIRRDRPDVVIVASNPRNLSCWNLRRVCRQVGTVCVAHTKVDSFNGLPDWAVDRLKRRFFHGFDAIIGYGARARQKALALGYPDDRISVARNTIDTTRIFAERDAILARAEILRSQAPTTNILMTIGRLEMDKRADDLLDAWPSLRHRHPQLCLVIVGGGPELQRLTARAAEIDADRIVVTGRVPDGDDDAWIAASAVCVFPGAVGLALNQSLALAVPTIIADESSSDAELVDHGVTGWRFPRGDVAALVDAVDHALDPRARDNVDSVTMRGRTLMRDEVTIELMAHVFHAVITHNLRSSSTQHSGSQA